MIKAVEELRSEVISLKDYAALREVHPSEALYFVKYDSLNTVEVLFPEEWEEDSRWREQQPGPYCGAAWWMHVRAYLVETAAEVFLSLPDLLEHLSEEKDPKYLERLWQVCKFRYALGEHGPKRDTKFCPKKYAEMLQKLGVLLAEEKPKGPKDEGYVLGQVSDLLVTRH